MEEEKTIHGVCQEGNREDLKQFLETNGNQDINKHDKRFGFAPIHIAVRRECQVAEDLLRVLLTHGADINSRTVGQGDTPLHIVTNETRNENEALLLTLLMLSHGADIEYRNDKYRRPYDIALSKSMLTLAGHLATEMTPGDAREELQKYQKKLAEDNQQIYNVKLVKAVMCGDQTSIDQCLEKGADPNFINQHGAASIHYTVTHCPLDKMTVLTQLVSAGADVNLQDYEGDTALNLVIKSTELRQEDVMLQLVSQLIHWGSDPDLKDLDEKNARMIASERSYTDITQLLSDIPPKVKDNYDDITAREETGDMFSSQASLSNIGKTNERTGDMGSYTPPLASGTIS